MSICFIIDGKKKYNPEHTIFDSGFSGFSINSITFSLWIFTTPLLRAISSFTFDTTIVCVVDLDNFVINSYLNGKKHTYNAFIDPSQIGQISKLEVVDSNEENGIEIVVPVQEDDFDEFVSKAKDLFKYFPVQPLIKGVTPFEYKERSLLFEGTGWKWFRHESDNRWGASGNACLLYTSDAADE